MTNATATSATLYAQSKALQAESDAVWQQAREADMAEQAAAQASVVTDVAAFLGSDPERVGQLLDAITSVAFIGSGRLAGHLVAALGRITASDPA